MTWKMRLLEDRGMMVYFHQHYFAAEQVFAFYITMAEHSREAKKFLARMTLKNQNDDRKSLSIIQDVISMDSAPRNTIEVLASKSVIFIHNKTMSGFMKLSKEKKQTLFETTIDILTQ